VDAGTPARAQVFWIALLFLLPLQTAWFVGVYATNRFLLNQQVRWPALYLCAVKRCQEPWIAVSTLRFRNERL